MGTHLDLMFSLRKLYEIGILYKLLLSQAGHKKPKWSMHVSNGIGNRANPKFNFKNWVSPRGNTNLFSHQYIL